MGVPSQVNPSPATNASGALSTAGQTVAAPAMPATLIPVHDKNGKQIIVTVNGVKAVVQGYDKATGKLHLTCADTPENQAKFKKSTQPKKDRTNEPSTDSTVKFFRDSQGNPLTITVKNPALASKVAGSQMILTQQEAEKAIKNSKRTLMHIVDKTAQAEAVNNPPIKTQKEEGGWWSRHWWKVLIGLLIATTIGILGFRKGGWWNKRKKSNPPSTTTPGQTTPPQTTAPNGPTLDPGYRTTPYHTDTPGQTVPNMSYEPTITNPTTPEPTSGPTNPAPTSGPAPTQNPLGPTIYVSAESGFIIGNSNTGR